ncbi:MAG: T9SS type A sorting domain-containing protein [Bacteroidetes bacterium]|nr:T9SS type A sorting domain-containing protein [Bacteroidota bacterium]
MKSTLFTFYLLLVSGFLFAQAPKLNTLLQGKTNFFEIENIAKTYFANKEIKGKGKFEDNEYVRYMRWYWHWKSRVNADGSFPDLLAQHEIYEQLNEGKTARKKTRATNWQNISQTTSPGGYNGMGRLLTVAFHPTDTNIIYVGAPIGGIWKTTTGGNSWTSLGDQLPYNSVGSIVINPVNPDIMYITVGKSEGWWEYGLGVYKSTNGGLTWAPTSQVSDYTQTIVYHKLLLDSNHPDVIYSAQSNGIWKSQDGGVTWYKIKNGTHKDIEFKPFNNNTLYAASDDYYGSSEVYKSVDTGNTWTKISNFTQQYNGLEMTVTLADSNYIGVGINGSNTNSFYLSTNGGNTFQLKNNNIDDNTAITISPTNKTKVYCGYVSNYRSGNSGTTFTQVTNWYNDGILPEVHADNHYAAVNPLITKYIYFCNDGGLYRLNEQTNQWKDLSNGLLITQFYKIANSQQDSVFMIGGTQDNGGRKRIGINVWDNTNGGDGMEVAVNPVNDQTIYTTYWGGTLYRSYDQWGNDTYYEISPDTNKGAWVTPYMIVPNAPSSLVAAYNDVWYTTNEGDNWVQLSNNLTGDVSKKLEVLDVAKSNPDVIYTGRSKYLYHTNNHGATWETDTVPGLTNLFEEMTSVMAHPKNANTIYITKGGYGVNSKVYKSIDNGNNWTNISFNIPNVPVNCLQIDTESDSLNVDIYIGTDVGVFYKKDSDITWQYYGTGLPNTQVSDIEIFYATGKLRAGTYGRGIWQTDIARHISPLGLNQTQLDIANVSLLENPVSHQIEILFTGEQGSQYQCSLSDPKGSMIWQQSIQTNTGESKHTFDIAQLNTGIYYLHIAGKGQQQHTFKILKK